MICLRIFLQSLTGSRPLFRALLLGAILLLGSGSAIAQGLLVKPETSSQGAVSLYGFEFNLAEDLSTDGALLLTFPVGFDLSKASIAASKTIRGGFSVMVRGQHVWIVRKGTGVPVSRGSKVDIWLSAVKNTSLAGISTISLRVFNENSEIQEHLKETQEKPISDKPAMTGSVSVVTNQ